MDEKAIEAEEIKRWLDSRSDFSLEMKIFSVLHSLGFLTEHGGTYSDPVTEKPRQFDVRARKRFKNFIIKLSLECKALSTEFPLVIQRVPRIKQESYHEIFWSYDSPETSVTVNMFNNPKALRSELGSSLYPIGGFVGKSSNQIGRKKGELFANDSEIYDKWSQAISSSYDLVSESCYEREELGLKNLLTMIIPVLVISNDCLWCVDYDQFGHRISEPHKSNEVDFFIGKRFWQKGQLHSTYTASHLKILTFDGFEVFASNINKNKEMWNKALYLDFPFLSENYLDN